MNEATLQANIIALARYTRWAAYHAYDSRRSAAGWPDLTLVGPSVKFRELKKGPQVSLVKPDQRVWLSRLRLAGADADVWTPADWPERITAELQGRPVPERPLPWTLEEALAAQREELARRARRDLAARARSS